MLGVHRGQFPSGRAGKLRIADIANVEIVFKGGYDTAKLPTFP